MSHEQIIIDGLVREIERMKRNDENNQNSLAAYRKEVMDIGTRLSSLNNVLRSLKGKSVFPVEDPNSKGKFAFLESYPVKAQDSALPLPGSSPEIASLVKEINKNPLNAMCDREGKTDSPLKESHRPTPEGLRIEPAPGRDQDHPPLGYRRGETVERGALYWSGSEWRALADWTIGGRSSIYGYPIANPIPANEGDSRLTESVAIPVGWVKSMRHIFTSPRAWRPLMAAGKCVGAIEPDPSIPWGEGYEAILPSEATEGDEYRTPCGWAKKMTKIEKAHGVAWRRRIPATTQTEPARDLSEKIAESVVQDLQQACRDRDELRATVERLEAELETTKRLLAESLVERDRLKNLHDARKVRIEGFRDVLRERLGDLV